MNYRNLKILFCLCPVFLLHGSAVLAQQEAQPAIDLQKARIVIDSLNLRGAALFEAVDSTGMYKMYASDADLGGITGKKIEQYWGKQMRDAAKNDRAKMSFNTRSLSTDGEFLFDAGTYTIQGKAGDIKNTGKYLIVWKWESGSWKLYRDIPL